MKDKILDNPIPETDFNHSKEAFKKFLISIGLFIILIIGISIQIKTKSQNNFLVLLIGLPIFGISMTSFVGLKEAVFSFIKKEPNHYKKIVGLVGNLFFIIFFLSLVIVNVVDIAKVMK